MVDCVGIDQARTASASCLHVATQKLGQQPVFWGRYFKDPGNTSSIQYQANLESDFFNTNNIKVLPVGRQTANVSEPDSDLGEQDGGDNAAAIIATFGADHLSTMPEVAVFLDAEINNPLNHVYYQGWSAGLIAGGSSQNVKFAPCVYGHHNDGETWSELGRALSAGSICGAAWIVFMDSMNFPIGPWQPARFTGKNMPASVRVAIAQRVLDFQDSEHSMPHSNPSRTEASRQTAFSMNLSPGERLHRTKSSHRIPTKTFIRMSSEYSVRGKIFVIAGR